MDSNRKIPIKSYLDDTDYRFYSVLLNKKDDRLQTALERIGYKIKTPQLTDDVATKLLAKGFAYKVSIQEFEEIESQFEKESNEFFQITTDEYKNLKSQLMN